jgi:hypothetical protein
MSVTEVTGYRTSDGRVFAVQREAEQEEARAVLQRVLNGGPAGAASKMTIDHLLSHADELVAALAPLCDHDVGCQVPVENRP